MQLNFNFFCMGFLCFIVTNQYKVGVLYCKEGQSTEEEMYNNRKLNHQLSVYF